MAGPADFFNDLPPEPGPAPPPTGRIDVYKGEAPSQKDNPASFFDDPTEKPATSPGTGHGYAETATLHGIHGLTSGFSDEMMGLKAASGIGEDSPEWMPPLPEQAMRGLARMGYQKLISGDKSASEAYTKARDEHRKALEESAAENPITAGVSDVAGSLAIPGGAELRGATMGERFLRGAYVGAAQGAVRGAGEAREMEDVPKSAAGSGMFGAGLGGILNSVLGPRLTTATKQAILNAANKYGVQLPNYMVSESPLMHFYGEHLRNLPIVGSKLAQAKEKATEGIENLKDRVVGSSAPSDALRKTASDAATQAEKDFTAARKQISERNYNAVNAALPNPNAKQIPMSLWRETADQLKSRQGFGGGPGSILQQAIDALNVKGGLTYEGLKNLRTDLYTKWKSMRGRSDTEAADYYGILHAITKDQENIVNAQGGRRAVDLWKKANAEHGANKEISKQITQAIGTGTKDTDAADKILTNISMTKPNVGPINTLRNNMRPSEWEKVQASVLGRMGSDGAGNFSLARMISADRKLSGAGRDAMFGVAGNPKRDAYDAIMMLGNVVEHAGQFRNYSNTAPMMIGAAAAIGMVNDAREGKFRTAGEIGAGAIIASILARPATAKSATAFSRAMSKYMGDPASWVAGKVPRAVETAARNFAITYANQTGMDKDKLVDAFTTATPMWSQ